MNQSGMKARPAELNRGSDSVERVARQDMEHHCLTIGERLAKLPGDRGWELLYRPHPKLSDMSIKEAVDMGGWLDEIYEILEYEESLPSAEPSDAGGVS